MQYTPEQFFALAELIEAAGGVHVDEVCPDRQYELSGPVGKRPGKRLYIPGCGNYSIFSIPYPREDGTEEEVKLCAVCDDIGQQPRFEECLVA